jgi:hypothetical protein
MLGQEFFRPAPLRTRSTLGARCPREPEPPPTILRCFPERLSWGELGRGATSSSTKLCYYPGRGEAETAATIEDHLHQLFVPRQAAPSLQSAATLHPPLGCIGRRRTVRGYRRHSVAAGLESSASYFSKLTRPVPTSSSDSAISESRSETPSQLEPVFSLLRCFPRSNLRQRERAKDQSIHGFRPAKPWVSCVAKVFKLPLPADKQKWIVRTC